MRGAWRSHARRVSSATSAMRMPASMASARTDCLESVMQEKMTAPSAPRLTAALQRRPASSAKTRSPPDGRREERRAGVGVMRRARCEVPFPLSLSPASHAVKGWGRAGLHERSVRPRTGSPGCAKGRFTAALRPIVVAVRSDETGFVQSPSTSKVRPSASRSMSSNPSLRGSWLAGVPATGPSETLIARRVPSGQSGMASPATSRRIL